MAAEWLDFHHDNQPVYRLFGNGTKIDPIKDLIRYPSKHLYMIRYKKINNYKYNFLKINLINNKRN